MGCKQVQKAVGLGSGGAATCGHFQINEIFEAWTSCS